MVKEISSIHNPLIKELVQLKEKSRSRKKKGLFIIEGIREITLAVKGGYEISRLLFLESIIDYKNLKDNFGEVFEYISVSEEIYSRLAYRESTEGVIAVAHSKNHNIRDFKPENKKPLILIGEGIEKPGNVGAILRTADAANIDAVIIADPKSDLYNPNVIRSSVGCVFTNNVFTGSNDEIITWLKSKNIKIYSAALSASVPYTSIDFTEASAIVVGTEATGLSDDWLKASDQNIIIPMEGEIDSMNVSVSAAIILFEAKRQRLPNK